MLNLSPIARSSCLASRSSSASRIYLYWAEQGRHAAPHFHARYGGSEAVFSIPDAEILAGSLPRRQVRLIQAWAELNGEALEQAWARAVNNEPPGNIPPLQR